MYLVHQMSCFQVCNSRPGKKPTYLMKKNVSTENVALLIVWNMKFLSVTVRSVLFSATRRQLHG
jgi:hypothetical protein